jgi:hypothetical protein
MAYDFGFTFDGSVCLLRPESDAAREWCDEHLFPGEYSTFGESIVVETNYMPGLIDGIHADGLTIEGIVEVQVMS